MAMKLVLAAFSVSLLIPSVVRAENAVTAGAVVVERPTLICLGFEWDIQGDDNRNAAVAVSYRPSGSPAWKEGMPLLRMGGERIFSRAVCRAAPVRRQHHRPRTGHGCMRSG